MASNFSGPTLADAVGDYLTGATVKAMLVGSGYTPNVDHDFRDDVTGEVSGTGYTAGGITLANVIVTYDATNNRVKIDADDAAFGTVTLTGVTGIVTYISTGAAATDRIISAHTFTSQSPNAVPFTYQWHADGVGYINL
jgi:hypothetical protein